MRRRQLIGGIGATVLLAGVAQAQVAGRMYRLGALILSPRDMIDHAVKALETSGFVEGRNLMIDADGFGLGVEALDRHAQALVDAHVDAIWASGEAPIRAGLRATRNIPIVAVSEDLVASGFAASLAAPGGNVTGISLLSPELDGKRLDLFIDMLPAARRIVALAELAATPPAHIAALQSAAQRRGVELTLEPIKSADDLAGAFDRTVQAGAGGIIVLASALLFPLRWRIKDLEAKSHVPVMHGWPATVRAGGLAGYNADLPQLYRTILAPIMARVLNGENPGSIPIHQPSTFELVVNLKTARALNLVLPDAFLARADEVIE